jgi:hypothetical protein
MKISLGFINIISDDLANFYAFLAKILGNLHRFLILSNIFHA